LFAGEGIIGRQLWKHYSDDVTSIEKDKHKASRIDYGEVIIGNNKDYLEKTKDADIVDADAYGLVFKLLRDIVNVSEKRKVIFFTESNPFNKSLHKAIEEILTMKPLAFWIEKANSSSVFYGYIIVN
jgi:hypothetical protein